MTSLRPARALAALPLLAAAALAAPACQRGEEGVRLPAEVQPVTITTPIRAADAEGAPATPAASPGAAPGSPVAVGGGLTGNTAAHRRSTMSAKLAGTVSAIHVREGDLVKAGDVLAELDTRDIRLQVRQASAAIEAARVQVDTAKLESDRAEKLLGTNAIPERQRDLAVAQLRAARAALRQAQVMKDMAEAALEDAEVRAPFDGAVIMRHVNEGEYVFNMPPAPVVTLEETGVIDVRVEVPAARLKDVRVGTRVRVSIPAVDREMTAPVTRIIPTVNPMTRSGTAIVELVKPDPAVIPGLFAEVTVLGPAPAQGAQAIPREGRAVAADAAPTRAAGEEASK